MVSSDVNSGIELSGRLLIGLFKAIGFLSFSLRGKIGFGLGYLCGMFPTRERLITRKQLELFFPTREANRIVPRVFGNAGRAILESMNLKAVQADPQKFVDCPNWDVMQKWLNEPRPLVILTGHTGNWDLLAAYGIARGVAITTIGREARSRAVHEALRWMREQYGVETIWRSNQTGLKRLISCFRENRVIAALIDQDTRVQSTFVPFFGRPARTPSSLIEMGRKFNARFAFAFIFRELDGRFTLTFGELDSALSTEEMLTEYSSQLEGLLRRYPEQWVWFHKRWRSSPDGKKLSTKEYLEWLTKEFRPLVQNSQ